VDTLAFSTPSLGPIDSAYVTQPSIIENGSAFIPRKMPSIPKKLVDLSHTFVPIPKLFSTEVNSYTTHNNSPATLTQSQISHVDPSKFRTPVNTQPLSEEFRNVMNILNDRSTGSDDIFMPAEVCFMRSEHDLNSLES